jgi:hypothetical protein
MYVSIENYNHPDADHKEHGEYNEIDFHEKEDYVIVGHELLTSHSTELTP